MDWTGFLRREGAPDENFEHFVHQIVWFHHRGDGALVYPRNEPGVEFTLVLDRDVPGLGSVGERIGWQCKWYYPDPRLDVRRREAGGFNQSTRMRDVEGAYERARGRHPDLKKWILCVPEPLTATEDTWLKSIEVGDVAIEWWASAEFDARLVGDAAVLRSAWLGELVLTGQWYADHFRRSLSWLGARYVPELHVQTGLDQLLTALVAVPTHGDALAGLADVWHGLASDLRAWPSFTSELSDTMLASADADAVVDELAQWAIRTAEWLLRLSAALRRGDQHAVRRIALEEADRPDLDSIVYALEAELPDEDDPDVDPEELEEAKGAIEELRDLTSRFGQETRRYRSAVGPLTTSLLVLNGRAGFGKSQYAALIVDQLTTGEPRGVLLHGRHFDPATTVESIPAMVGFPNASAIDLLHAINATGAALGVRVPVVIDGLNEPLDVSVWMGLLAELREAVKNLPYVVAVATVRDTYIERVLPADRPPVVTLDGFEPVLATAAARYLDAYHIRLTGPVPVDFADPLLLKMFCEATNPDRQVWVDADYSAASRYEVYEAYLRDVACRIRERLQLPFADAVRTAIDRIGRAFWDANARSLGLQTLRDVVADDPTLLETISEGVLIRSPASGDDEVAYAYDALGGYAIARSVISAPPAMPDWAVTDEVRQRLGEDPPGDLHPLHEDITRAAVQLAFASGHDPTAWDVGPSWFNAALSGLVEAAPAQVPAAATQRLSANWVGLGPLRERVLEHVSSVATEEDPLNADILHEMLGSLSLRDRDLTWTEWLRSRREVLPEDIDYWASLLNDDRVQPVAHRRRARYVAWLLTSTDHPTRDRATRFLYEWGKRFPEALLELAHEVAGVTDIYVPERVAAAVYGVAMAKYWDPEFTPTLRAMGEAMAQLYLNPDASAATTHVLLRSYAMWIADLAVRYAGLERETAATDIRFAHPRPDWELIAEDDPRSEQLEWAIQMDFARYTVGRIAPDEWQAAAEPTRSDLLAQIRWRVFDLGYRADDFKDLDREISLESYGEREAGRIERYGKKYSRIAFYELAGRLQDEGRLPRAPFGRVTDVDLDPSFPIPAPRMAVDLPQWLSAGIENDLDWLGSATTTVPPTLVWRDEIDGDEGPWILVDGYIVEPLTERRRLYVNVSLVAHGVEHGTALQDALTTAPFPGDVYEHLGGTDFYLYAGEIPWSPLFGYRDDEPSTDPRVVDLIVDPNSIVPYEALSATYGWESYHSLENRAGGAVVPSSAVCAALQATNRPQTFDLYGLDERRLSITRRPPGDRDGHLLYLRQSALASYLAERGLQGTLFAWGERQLLPRDGVRLDDEERAVIEGGANVFRRIWVPRDGLLPPTPPLED